MYRTFWLKTVWRISESNVHKTTRKSNDLIPINGYVVDKSTNIILIDHFIHRHIRLIDIRSYAHARGHQKLTRNYR